MTSIPETVVPATVRARLAALVGGRRGRILGAVSVGWFFGLGVRLAVPVLVPYIRADLGLGLTAAGLLLSALWFTYALFQLPGGLLADRVGERLALVVSSALAIVGVVASAAAPTVPALFGGILLLGSAAGLYGTTRFTILSDVYPEQAATAIGLTSAVGNLGTVLLPIGMGVLAAVLGWRAGFATVAPMFGVAAVALWLSVPWRTSGDESVVDDIGPSTVRAVFAGITTRRALVFAVAMLLMAYVYQGFISFYPTYLAEVKGLPEQTAALLYGVFFGTAVLIQPLSGVVSDWIGDRSAMMAFAGLTAAALVALLLAEGFWPLLAVSVLASSQLGFWPIVQAAVIDALPTEMQGTGFGLIRTAYLLLAATSPAVVGLLADRGQFDEAFLLLIGCALAAVLLGLLLAPAPSRTAGDGG